MLQLDEFDVAVTGPPSSSGGRVKVIDEQSCSSSVRLTTVKVSVLAGFPGPPTITCHGVTP